MLPRCGRAAHICEANRNCTMKRNKNLRENRKNRNCLQNREIVMRIQGFRGNCDSKGKLGMCPSLAEPDSDGFSKNSVFSYEPQAAKFPVPCFWHTERVVRKATAFRGGANKTAPPCEIGTGNKYLATVPGEQLQ